LGDAVGCLCPLDESPSVVTLKQHSSHGRRRNPMVTFWRMKPVMRAASTCAQLSLNVQHRRALYADAREAKKGTKRQGRLPTNSVSQATQLPRAAAEPHGPLLAIDARHAGYKHSCCTHSPDLLVTRTAHERAGSLSKLAQAPPETPLAGENGALLPFGGCCSREEMCSRTG